MNFKKLISSATMLLVAAAASAQSNTHIIDLDTGKDFGSNGAATEVYYGLTHKLVSGNSLSAETVNILEWRDSRKNDTKLKHKYLRFAYYQPGLYTFGESAKFNLLLRWVAPTTNADQIDGTFGIFSVKPSVSGKAGPLSYKLTQGLAAYLQRQRAERNQKVGPMGSASANRLFAATQEIELSLPLGLPDLAFNAVFVNAEKYYGAANGADPYWSYSFEQDYEIRYAVQALDGTEFALYVYNATLYKNTDGNVKPGDPANDLWFNEGSSYGFRITKAF